MSSQMHVLFLPSFYSDKEKTILGSFFKEQALAILRADLGIKIGIAYCEPRSLRRFHFAKLKESHFQVASYCEDGITTMRLQGWNPYLQSNLGGRVWSRMTEYLVNRYISKYGKPDLIHAHNVFWAGYAAMKIKRSLNIPYILTEHSGGLLGKNIPVVKENFIKDVFLEAAEVVTVSSALAYSLYPLLMGRSYKVIPNCVDLRYFSLPEKPRTTVPFVFLAVARLTKNKGIDILLKAFAEKYRNRRDVTLLIGGDGPMKQDLIDLCEKLNVNSNVMFLGELGRDGVREAMCSSNALVVSSYHETFGIVLIEAMATGIPVITTRCGGPSEIVTKNTGLQVEPGDVLGLARAMEELKNSNLYSVKIIRDHIEKKFSNSVFVNSLKSAYENCLL